MASEELHQGANGEVFNFARILRKKQTSAEDLLWNRLRGQKLDGYKFRRQHPIKNWIADYLPKRTGLTFLVSPPKKNKYNA